MIDEIAREAISELDEIDEYAGPRAVRARDSVVEKLKEIERLAVRRAESDVELFRYRPGE